VLERSRVDPTIVVFLAHSTTQATNALLEGDAAPVASSDGESSRSRAGTRAGAASSEIEPRAGRFPSAHAPLITTDKLTEELVREILYALRDEGTQVVVASGASASTTRAPKKMVMRVASEISWRLPADTRSPSCTGAYHAHAATASSNASHLPKM